MENLFTGRKVKMKILVEDLYKTHSQRLFKTIDEFSELLKKEEDGATINITKYNDRILDIIIEKRNNNLWETLLQIITEQVVAEQNLRPVSITDYRRIEDKMFNLGWDRILTHINILGELKTFSDEIRKKKLPVESKDSKATKILNRLSEIRIKERSHTTDIVHNDNHKSKLKIINYLNIFFVKRHLNEFLRYQKIKKEEEIETEETVEIKYLNNLKIEREAIENRVKLFFKDFEENKKLNKKEPPDKEKSLREENENLNEIEKIQSKPQNAKHKKAETQCSIEEQREKGRKRFKPPDTGWI